MNVYTYYDYLESLGRQDELLREWECSWKAHGWTPVTLGLRHAQPHRHYPKFKMQKVHQLPSVNPRGYDESCWLRWFALDNVGGGVMVDYDVINKGLTPREVILGSPIILEQHRVPCAVATDAKGATAIADAIMDHAPKVRGNHYSDMHFFQDSSWPHIRTCREYNGLDWQEAKLIHYATGACHRAGKTKIQAIRE